MSGASRVKRRVSSRRNQRSRSTSPRNNRIFGKLSIHCHSSRAIRIRQRIKAKYRLTVAGLFPVFNDPLRKFSQVCSMPLLFMARAFPRAPHPMAMVHGTDSAQIFQDYLA